MKRLRLMLWLLVAVMAGGALWLFARPRPSAAPAETSFVSIGGVFTLTDSDGKTFASGRLAGTPYVLFFGFTNCPDVCPTTLARLIRLRRQLGAGDGAFEILFVTVDPERDRPADLKRYLSLYAAPIVGLTGSPADIARVKKTFGIYSAKVPQPGGGYSVDHSAAVLLFGRDGGFGGTIAPDEGDAPALGKLKRLTA
ncbi:MAG: SCO family protein [Sphingomicrobium sp.]